MNLAKTTLFRASLIATAVAFLSLGCTTETDDEETGAEEPQSVASEATTLYLLPLKGTEQATTRDALNLRSGPSTSHAVKLVIPAGARVTYGRRAFAYAQNGYWPVYYGDIGGWAYGAYLSSTASGNPPGSAQGGEQPSGSVYGAGCVGRGNAAYCGGNFGVQGSASSLYRCENGYRTLIKSCANGCVAYTYVGSPDDHCR